MQVRIAIAGSAIWASVVLAASAPARPFDPSADARRTETCFATYMTLAEAQATAGSRSDADEQAEAGRGLERIKPFVNAAASAIGEKNFYRDAAISRQADHQSLMTSATGEAAHAIADRLSADARDCDRQLDVWHAPKLCFVESHWKACPAPSASPGRPTQP